MIRLRTPIRSIVPKGASAEIHASQAARELATAIFTLLRSGESGRPPQLPVFRPWPEGHPKPEGQGRMIVLGGFPLDLVCFVQERSFYAWEADDGHGRTLPAGFKASRQGYVSPAGGLVQELETTRAGRLDSSTLAGLLRSRANTWQREHGGSYESAVYSVRLTPADIGAEKGKAISERTASAMTAEIRQIICPDVAPPESATESLRRIALEVLKAGASTRYADAPEEAARILAETGLSPESQAATWRARLAEARKRMK